MSIYINGQHSRNVTLKYLYDVFRNLGNNHKLINTTTIGDIFEVDLVETTYPLFHIATDNAQFDTHQLTYNFQLILMDLVSKDESNEEYVLTDMLEVIGDIISQFKNSDFATSVRGDERNEIRIQDSITCEPFTERFDNEVTGWTANIAITVAFDASACANVIPLAD